MITQIDHVVIPWPDLDEAVALYESLGFSPTVGGHHVELGTSNAMVEFPRSFLELVGVVDPVRADASGSLERFKGSSGVPVSYLLRSSSVEEDLTLLKAAGLATSGPRAYERHGDDGSVSVLQVGMVIGDNDEVMVTLVEPQGTAGARRSVSHPNGAIELAALSFPASAWEVILAAYRALGVEVQESEQGDGGGFVARVGLTEVRIGRAFQPEMTLAVRSLSETAAYLQEAGARMGSRPAPGRPSRRTVEEWRGRDLSYLSFVEAQP